MHVSLRSSKQFNLHFLDHRFSLLDKVRSNRNRSFFSLLCQRSNLTMEQAADISCPSPVEKVTTTETNETGKRKSEEQEQPELIDRGKKRRGTGGKKLRPGERYIPPPQKRNAGVSFSQEHFKETSYYFEGGLRKVHPYYFEFKTYCKGRWIGKTLLEVFKSEFRAESIDYYQKAAKEGRILLNDQPMEDLSVVLRASISSMSSPIF